MVKALIFSLLFLKINSHSTLLPFLLAILPPRLLTPLRVPQSISLLFLSLLHLFS